MKANRDRDHMVNCEMLIKFRLFTSCMHRTADQTQTNDMVPM